MSGVMVVTGAKANLTGKNVNTSASGCKVTNTKKALLNYVSGLALVPVLSCGLLLMGGGAAWGGSDNGSILPYPSSPFNGKIERSVKNSIPNWPGPVTAPKGAPNIIIILIDDCGYAATDLFGGPVATPNLDKFAAQGLRYNNFHTTAICSPTRASLLTGRNDHRVNMGAVEEGTSGFPGYNGSWPRSVASVAEVLRDNGYSTAAFGKWHDTPYREISPIGPFNHWPTGLGFEYFYGFMAGESSQWTPTLYLDTIPVETHSSPRHPYYLTTDITNKAISWIHTHESLAPNKPYFLYFATGATHEPHHVSRKWIKKYHGKFRMGWDKLRQEIFARQKKLGVIPADSVLTTRPKAIPAWNSLSAGQKKLLEREMDVFAGYLAKTDQQVGRLLRVARSGPEGKNTLIFYIVGDNNVLRPSGN